MDLSEAFDVINHGLLMVKLEIYIFLDIPLKTDSKSETIFDKRKPFKNDEQCFLFHLKSSFRSQDIKVFGHVEKTARLERWD